jgi:hypothetical protein
VGADVDEVETFGFGYVRVFVAQKFEAQIGAVTRAEVYVSSHGELRSLDYAASPLRSG